MVDNIRQTYIGLHYDADEKSILAFLRESQQYFRKAELSILVVEELLFTVTKCFSIYTNIGPFFC